MALEVGKPAAVVVLKDPVATDQVVPVILKAAVVDSEAEAHVEGVAEIEVDVDHAVVAGVSSKEVKDLAQRSLSQLHLAASRRISVGIPTHCTGARSLNTSFIFFVVRGRGGM